jgi:hypothetical protein
LLVDTPEAIRSRKAELTEREIGKQLARWRELAKRGFVYGGLRVDAPPAVLAERVVSLIAPGQVDDPSATLEGLDGQGATPRLITALGIGDFGAEPAGDEGEVASFAAVPSARRPRIIFPVGNRRAALAALKLYQPQRPMARVAVGALRVLTKIGLSPAILRTRLRAKEGGETLLSLREELRRMLGDASLEVSVLLGTPGVHQKALLQAVSADGRILAYAKVGWTTSTAAMIDKEHQALSSQIVRGLSSVEVPRVLGHRVWGAGRLLVLGPPSGSEWKGGPRRIGPRHFHFLRELFQATATEVSVDERLGEFEDRAEALRGLGLSYDAHLLKWATDTVRLRVGGLRLPHGALHGDFAPWNTLSAGDRLFVLDWEYWAPRGTPGWDYFHFVVQTSSLVGGSSGGQVIRRIEGGARAEGEALLRSLGVPVGLYSALCVLYLIDIAGRSLERDPSLAKADPSRLCQTWRSMLFLAGSGAWAMESTGSKPFSEEPWV